MNETPERNNALNISCDSVLALNSVFKGSHRSRKFYFTGSVQYNPYITVQSSDVGKRSVRSLCCDVK